VQFGKWKGARVIAAGRAGQEAHLRALGADAIVDSAQKELSAVEVDAVLDLVGGDLQKRAWRWVKRGGAFASTLGPPVEEPTRRDVRSVAVEAQTNVRQLGEIGALVERDDVKVFVTKVLPLAKAREAHELLEAHGVVGKAVLTVP
jgi:NADPH:quinone reductase-like Zn-dependent oxidoreductase